MTRMTGPNDDISWARSINRFRPLTAKPPAAIQQQTCGANVVSMRFIESSMINPGKAIPAVSLMNQDQEGDQGASKAAMG